MSEAARKSEVTTGTAIVKWRDLEFTVSTEYDDYPVDFMEAVEDGRTVGIVRGALGPAQWRVVKALNLKMADLAELAEGVADALGFNSTGE